MKHPALVTVLAGALCATIATPAAAQGAAAANASDQALAGVFEAREQDWRNGAVVYQVYVDRFAPAADLEAKRALYPAPKRLRAWSELPTHGAYLPEAKVWSHEIDFWGGDLQSLRGKLDYIQGLGADVLYLNPIDLAYTNHKYDTLDYRQVSPEYGTRDDARALARDVHARQAANPRAFLEIAGRVARVVGRPAESGATARPGGTEPASSPIILP